MKINKNLLDFHLFSIQVFSHYFMTYTNVIHIASSSRVIDDVAN